MTPFLPVAPKKKRADKAHKSKSTSLQVAPPTRIGFGEYFHPTLFDKAAVYARLEFIGKIEELAQEVLVDLADSLRPNYERVRTVMDQSELLSLDAEILRHLAKNGRNEFASLLAALEGWIERHNLNAEWVRNMALRTLFHWTGRIVVVQGQQLRFMAPIPANHSEMQFFLERNPLQGVKRIGEKNKKQPPATWERYEATIAAIRRVIQTKLVCGGSE